MISLRSTLAFTISTLAAAQWLDDKPLGSCADVDCPRGGTDACRISNQTYNRVGVDTFPFNSSNSESGNLTWTVGFHDYTNYDPDVRLERTIEKAFFLGTPEGVNLTTTNGSRGCAVILEAYNTTLKSNRASTSQTCESAIGGDCQRELREDTLKFARERGNRFNGSSDACDGLEEYLQSVSGDDSKCRMNWSQVHYIPLTGASAPKALTEVQNSTTDCYPTEPKTNDLAFVLNWNNTGTMYYNDTFRMISSVNVALTVLWDQADAQTQQSHVSCLWPVDETTQSRSTQITGQGEDNAAGRLQGAMVAVFSAALMMAYSLT